MFDFFFNDFSSTQGVLKISAAYITESLENHFSTSPNLIINGNGDISDKAQVIFYSPTVGLPDDLPLPKLK